MHCIPQQNSSAKLPHRELSFAGLPSAVSYCFAKLDRDLRRMDEILGTLNDDLKACREWKIGPGWNPNHWCKYLLPYWFYQNLCGNVEREHISKIPLSASCSSSFNLWFATSPCKGNHYFKSYGWTIEPHMQTILVPQITWNLKPWSLSGNNSSSLHRIWRPSVQWPSHHSQEILRLSGC